MLDSKPLLFPSDFPSLRRNSVSTLQVNLGFKCNQTCQHCHVNAGPDRKEVMSDDVMMSVMRLLKTRRVSTLDLTGGAPELHPLFRELVITARQQNIHVMDRCNLTILSEPGQESLAVFLAENQVEIIASLPCYLEDNVDGQRGKGVFEKSISGLQQLNALGYGKDDSGLQLNLVYNPLGPYLPPAQAQLEADYRKQLTDQYGISFNSLFTITNMPISRFGSMLQSTGQFKDYMNLLKQSFQTQNLDTVMCKDLLSIDWQGYVYDCDFNQMLDMKIHSDQKPLHVSQLNNRQIVTGQHCYGCTAGQGSSCGGALS